MSAPLSGGQFDPPQNLATGMFGGKKQTIAPRGSYVIQGVGDPKYGYQGNGYFWNMYANLTSGTSDAASIATETGVPVGTPSPAAYDTLKVGGGPSQAEVPDYGGTAAYSSGSAAY